MKENYAASTWHYSNSDGVVPDLHHGIFYKGMGGGESKLLCLIVVAYESCLHQHQCPPSLLGIATLLIDSNGNKFGVQCLSNYGHAVSAGVQGSISDIDGIPTMYW